MEVQNSRLFSRKFFPKQVITSPTMYGRFCYDGGTRPVVENGIAGGIRVSQVYFYIIQMIYQIINLARINNAIFH